jgi:3-hydroxyacyl-[acyl-carrier-protein] dehydratase
VNDSDPIALGLPHRAPFIFVDVVLELQPGESAICGKTFAPGEPLFRGHFPGDPIVPGVILVEALAQTAGLVGGRESRRFRLAAIKTMKFPGAALPNEEIILRARRLAMIGVLWQFEVVAQVGGRIVAEGIIVLGEG